MANTYDPTLTTTKDRVRFYLGDVDSPWILSNEEITASLVFNGGDPLDTAISMCTSIIARFTRKSSAASVGPFSINYALTADQYKSLLSTLQAERSRTRPAAPYASGYTLGQEEDGDAEPFLFDTRMNDNLYVETYEGARDRNGGY